MNRLEAILNTNLSSENISIFLDFLFHFFKNRSIKSDMLLFVDYEPRNFNRILTEIESQIESTLKNEIIVFYVENEERKKEIVKFERSDILVIINQLKSKVIY